MSTETRLWIWAGFAAAVGGLLYLLAPILTPFLFSALLAYLGDPLVDRLERLPRVSRSLAVAIVFLLLTLILIVSALVLVPLVLQQYKALVAGLPVFAGWLHTTALPWLQEHFGVEPAMLELTNLQNYLITYLDQVGTLARNLLASLTQSSLVVLGWLFNLLLTPVVTFYLLLDWDRLVAGVRDLLPRRIEPTVMQMAQETNEVLGAFLRGQLLVMLLLGTLYSFGLFLIGLDFALLIGTLAGLVSFVPYLGLIIGFLAASLAALLQFQDLFHLLPVALVFAGVQMLDGTVITPRLVGNRIGLHPVAVIFAVAAGGHLFGFLGVLLALPLAAVIMVLLRHTHDEYLKSMLYDG